MTDQYQSTIRGRTASEIASSIEASIRGGHLAPGNALPPIRSLAQELQVGHVTAANAYRRLAERGLLVTRRRAGTRVADQPPLAVRPRWVLPPGVRDLAFGNPDPKLLPPMPRLRPVSVGYGAASVEPELEEIIRADFRADGIVTGSVTIVAGGMDGIERVLTARVRHGDRVGIEDPGFPRTIDLVAALGLVAEPIAVDERGLVPDALQAAVGRGLEALIVTPRAQNPSGAAMDEQRVTELHAILANKPQILILEDDHAGPVAGAPFHSLTLNRQHYAVVRSFSKALGPDLRLAALAGDDETVARVAGRLRLGMGWVSHLLQRTVVTMLKAPRTKVYLARAADAYAERRAKLLRALAAEGINAWGRSGLNVWVPVLEETTTVQALLVAGYGAAAGERYRFHSAPAIRVSISRLDPREAPKVARAIALSQRDFGHARD